VSGDEDDRDLLPAKLQFPLEIVSVMPGMAMVQDQTISLAT